MLHYEAHFPLKAIALAVLAALGAAAPPARADDPTAAQLMNPNEGTVSVGAAGITANTKERSVFAQYNGLREHDFFLLLDAGLVRFDSESGSWLTIEGVNLGLDTREARVSYQVQGNWKAYANYNGMVRWSPRTINSGATNFESSTPTINLISRPGAGQDYDLKTERKIITVGGEKWISRSLMFEASFRNEDKDGSRLSGRGFNCASATAPPPVCPALASGTSQWAVLLLAEPIHSNTKQIDAKVNWFTGAVSLTAGYYGSWYTNDVNNISPTISGNLNNPLGTPLGQNGSLPLSTGLRGILQQPMAVAPDNQAHQFYLSGTYTVTPTITGNFKLAYTHATQRDDYASRGFTDAPAGVSNYGGVVNTTLAQASIRAKPVRNLTLTANVRYEDREDKSPLALYNIEGTNRYANGTYSVKKTSAKLEASYQLPQRVKAIAGYEYEHSDRGQYSSPECITLSDTDCRGDSVAGLSGLRAKTYENTFRFELRRAMSDTVNGSVMYSKSDREGSSWLKPAALPATGSTAITDDAIYSRTAIFPFIFMDRTRDKVRGTLDWAPTEKVSLQLYGERGKDEYTAPTTKGLSDTRNRLLGVDVVYAITAVWKLSAYYTFSEQTLRVAHSTGYIADLKDRNNTGGINLTARISDAVQVGADVTYINDRNVYQQLPDSSASATNVAFLASSGGLPDVTYRDLRWKFFGKFAVQKNADIRVDLIHSRIRFNEWTWGYNGQPFAYSDNTTVTMEPRQTVTFVGVRYSYRWQ